MYFNTTEISTLFPNFIYPNTFSNIIMRLVPFLFICIMRLYQFNTLSKRSMELLNIPQHASNDRVDMPQWCWWLGQCLHRVDTCSLPEFEETFCTVLRGQGVNIFLQILWWLYNGLCKNGKIICELFKIETIKFPEGQCLIYTNKLAFLDFKWLKTDNFIFFVVFFIVSRNLISSEIFFSDMF